MKVSREWFADIVELLEEGAEIELYDSTYAALREALGVVEKPRQPWPFPPEDVYPCRVYGKHMWGGNRCRHCDDPYPPEYAALIPKTTRLVQPIKRLLLEGETIRGKIQNME